MSSQLQPLAHLYGTFTEDMRTDNQNHLSMPDPDDFIHLKVLIGSRKHSFCTQSPPYPVYDEDEDTSSEHIVYDFHSASFHQTTAGDSLKSQDPLSLMSVEDCGSDRVLPVVEPGCDLRRDSRQQHDGHLAQSQLAGLDAETRRRPSTDSDYGYETADGCSQSEPFRPSDLPSPASETPSLRQYSHVQSMSSDSYQPTLGGLHSISDIQFEDSKRDRVKRVINRLNPLRRQGRDGGESTQKTAVTFTISL